MKKIMFDDKYGLNTAVLERRKTKTRRIIGICEKTDSYIDRNGFCICHTTECGRYAETIKSKYAIGEEVAIAQSYKDAGLSPRAIMGYVKDSLSNNSIWAKDTPGWTNKMFVRADLMPHRIRITDIKVERLQDISEEDCLKEGIQEYFPYIDRNPNDRVRTFQYFRDGKIRHRMSPAPECFALLINDICGHGTWNRNPWVFVYSFELVY